MLAVFYAVQIPPGEGVDEIQHFKYVLYIKNEKRLPIQPTERGIPAAVVMGHHPPLYYALLAMLLPSQSMAEMQDVFHVNPHFVWAENQGENGWNVMIHAGQDDFPGDGIVRTLFLARMWGIVLGVVTLFGIYQAAKWAFPEIAWMPLVITAVTAFNPSFIYMSTTIHHDILQATWFALGIWWIMRYLRKRTPYDAFIFGVLVGCAILTKVSGVVLGIGVAIAVVATAWRAQNWRIFWRDGMISGTIAFLIAGWWFIRNFVEYGDLLGWKAYSTVFHFNLRSEPSTILGVGDFFKQASRNFWGGFGFMHITFPEISRFLWWGTAFILLGWFILLLRNRNFFRRYAIQLLISAVVLLGILGIYVRFSIINLGAGHGRYLFPAAFSIGVLIAGGVLGYVGQKRLKWAGSLLAIGLWGYGLWLPVMHVFPKYMSPQTVEAIPEAAYPVDQIVSPGVRVTAVTVENDQLLRPDMALDIVLYVQNDPDASSMSDPYLQLTLEDAHGNVIASKSRWPVPSLPPDSWTQGSIYPVPVSFYIPGIELPGRVIMKARAENLELPPVIIKEFQTIGGATAVDDDIPETLNVLFNNELVLRDFEFSDKQFQPGDMAIVNLYWQVEQVPETLHTLFVHLVDGSGQVVAQLDRPIGGSATPVTSWQQGQIWRDSYPLLLPETLPEGSYTVRVGMYDWPSTEPLPIEGTAQNIWQLGIIEVILEE